MQLLEAADVTLSSGQPKQPLVLTYQLDQPLPENSVLYVVHADGTSEDVLAAADGATATVPSEVLVADMSPDRRTGTVTVDHLSLFQWFAGASTNLIGRFTGQRADPPNCPGPYPPWMTQLPVFLDEQNAPMRVCVERDGKDPDTAVVKIANNRGGYMRITSPVTPSWAWQSMFGADIQTWQFDLAAAALSGFGVPANELSRSWLLPPGAQVHIGFSRQAVADQNPLTIRGRLPLLGAVGGAVHHAINAAADPSSQLLMLGMYGVCAQSASAAAADNFDAAGLAQASAQYIGCVLDDPDHVVRYLKGKISADTWRSMERAVGQAMAGAVQKLGWLLGVGQLAFVALDLGATFALNATPGAWTITLYPPLPRAGGSGGGVRAADLAGAQVPSLCGHPAGQLVDGKLPIDNPSAGFVSLVLEPSGMVPGPLLGDVTGDGLRDAVVVAECSTGGVSWPMHLLLYGPGPKLLSAVDLGPETSLEHADVTGLQAEGTDVVVTWNGYEGAGGDPLIFSGRLHYEDGQLQLLDAGAID
ncbi:hypothetical protein [Geodermatophilus sabuli]|uniref:hypothetical protein n=1 Tax=Geodermatophilus sabuli TaxID=1564158 RepID=UPI00117A91DE|nr:hypothetical protein [Geodermatophilus sabuli]MBB3084201.1 hypothetical protein [Geodermatophilus sabuli]